jgi:hypothetical protein
LCTLIPLDPQLAKILSSAIYCQILFGEIHLEYHERDAAVECGIFRHTPELKLDEPITMLAASHWIDEHIEISLGECARRDADLRFGRFDIYLAFYLHRVFKDTPELNSIFTFRSDFAQRRSLDLSWQQEKFELVVVSSTEPHISSITEDSAPTGLKAYYDQEVLDWISTNNGCPCTQSKAPPSKQSDCAGRRSEKHPATGDPSRWP